MTSGGKREGAGRKAAIDPPAAVKKQVGRPPLNPGNGNSVQISTRLGKADHQQLMKFLKQRNLQPGAWMRTIILDALHLALTQEIL